MAGGDALDVVAQHLAVALRATLAEALAALATSRHDQLCVCVLSWSHKRAQDFKTDLARSRATPLQTSPRRLHSS